MEIKEIESTSSPIQQQAEETQKKLQEDSSIFHCLWRDGMDAPRQSTRPSALKAGALPPPPQVAASNTDTISQSMPF